MPLYVPASMAGIVLEVVLSCKASIAEFGSSLPHHAASLRSVEASQWKLHPDQRKLQVEQTEDAQRAKAVYMAFIVRMNAQVRMA